MGQGTISVFPCCCTAGTLSTASYAGLILPSHLCNYREKIVHAPATASDKQKLFMHQIQPAIGNSNQTNNLHAAGVRVVAAAPHSAWLLPQGGSRRRLKRHARKVRVGVVKAKKNMKAKMPLELLDGRTMIQERLNAE